jgi:hypothetical protein
MSDDFDHAADAMDRFLQGEGQDELWICPKCGAYNDERSGLNCVECGESVNSGNGIDRLAAELDFFNRCGGDFWL